MRVLPNFIIIGGAKCGSTSLAHALRKHRDVYIETGGINMFSQPGFDERNVEALALRMEGGRGKKAVGFKRPFLAEPDVPERVHSIAPDCKLLVMLRDPVARAVSGYFQAMEGYDVPVLEVNEGFARMLDAPVEKRDPRSWRVFDEGMYGKHLARWLRYFPREQLLIQIAEESRNDPAAAVRGACEFLGLDDQGITMESGRSTNPGHYSLTHQRIGRKLRRIYDRQSETGEWMHRRGKLGKISRAIVKRGIDDGLLMLFLKQKAPKLSEAMHRRVAELFRDDLDALESLLGRNLTIWPTAKMLRSGATVSLP